MKVGSLFTGIGGFDVGLEAAGMDIAWQCEQDESCVRVLRERFPNAEIYRDVREVDGRSVEPVRLLCGGFPCQDLSVAGRRAGLAGKRSGLFYEFMRLVDECSPDWVLLENVPGLLSSWSGDTPSSLGVDPGSGRTMDLEETSDFSTVLDEIGKRGYWFATRVFDSQFFGLAQRRKRVFIVGSRRNRTSAAEVLFERESVPGDSPPRRETGKDVAAALTSGVATGRGVNRPGRRREDDVNLVAALTSNGVGTCRADDNQAQAGHLVPIDMRQASRGEKMTNNRESGGGGPPGTGIGNDGDPCPTLGGSHVPAVSMCLNGKRGNRYDGESETFITERYSVRRLLPVEAERLQGFQDGWTDVDGTSDSARYRQLGNAVSVPVAAWIGRRIMEVDSQ